MCISILYSIAKLFYIFDLLIFGQFSEPTIMINKHKRIKDVGRYVIVEYENLPAKNRLLLTQLLKSDCSTVVKTIKGFLVILFMFKKL